jgi:hypothetical protein
MYLNLRIIFYFKLFSISKDDKTDGTNSMSSNSYSTSRGLRFVYNTQSLVCKLFLWCYVDDNKNATVQSSSSSNKRLRVENGGSVLITNYCSELPNLNLKLNHVCYFI